MAKSATQFVGDIRGYLAKGKLKPARKALEKAHKAGHTSAAMDEVVFELLLAEGGGGEAADQLFALASSAPARVPAALKNAEAHLRHNRHDHDVRDVVWELAVEHKDFKGALRHLTALVEGGNIDGQARTKALLDRKDVVGATAIFLLASTGLVKTDRMKLADRLLSNPQGAELLAGVAQVLHDSDRGDGAVHYVLAQHAQKNGDKDRFLEFAGRAFEENPEELWTWTAANVAGDERLEIALHQDSLNHLLDAAGTASDDHIVGVANRSRSDGNSGKALRGLALLLTNKAKNACRVLEGLVSEAPDCAAPMAKLLTEKSGAWRAAPAVRGCVVAAGLSSDPAQVAGAVDALLEVDAGGRDDAWTRAAPMLLKVAPDRADLRGAYGRVLLTGGDTGSAAKLIEASDHLDMARGWADAGHKDAVLLRRAADVAEEFDAVADHAEWMFQAAQGDTDLLAELGKQLSGSSVSPETALQSATSLLKQGQKKQAADLLSRLPLDEATGKLVENLLRGKQLLDDRDFQSVNFRTALALGDANRARRLFKGVSDNVQGLAREASRHGSAGRVLADVLIEQGKGEVAVGLVEARRDAGDDPRVLIKLADSLLSASPRLAQGRLVRGKILQALQRDEDAVRDLRSIPANAAELDEAFELLGELAERGAPGSATLGRVDIHVTRKQFRQAIQEAERHPTDPAQRLERLDRIVKDASDLQAGHRARAAALIGLDKLSDAAHAHLRRFDCSDADPSAISDDLAQLAKRALEKGDIDTACATLESLPDRVSDGADRAIRAIGDDKRSPLLILRSKMLLQLGRTEEAVRALSDLVRADKKARAQAAQALDGIIDSGQARPAADFALAETYDAMERTADALAALQRLYDADVTSKDQIIAAAEKLLVRADDAAVRIFLAKVALDMRNAKQATEHLIYARRLRPGVRRECVELLRKALDLDAFAPEAHFAVAEAHLAGDEADDAVRHFRAAVEVDRSRASGAITAISEAAPRSKHPALLWLAVGTTHAEFLGDHVRAVESFTQGLAADPTTELRVPLLLGRGDSYASQQLDDDAFDDFDEASKHDLLERRYYEYLRARHRKRELAKAEAASVDVQGDFARACDAVGRFVRLGRAQEAVEVAQAARAANPTGLGPRYLVGVALHAAGRFDAAAQVLERVRETAGADTEVGRAARMLLAESYLDNGDRHNARACLTEVEAVDASYPGLKARRAALAPPADDPLAPPPLFISPEFPRPTE